MQLLRFPVTAVAALRPGLSLTTGGRWLGRGVQGVSEPPLHGVQVRGSTEPPDVPQPDHTGRFISRRSLVGAIGRAGSTRGIPGRPLGSDRSGHDDRKPPELYEKAPRAH